MKLPNVKFKKTKYQQTFYMILLLLNSAIILPLAASDFSFGIFTTVKYWTSMTPIFLVCLLFTYYCYEDDKNRVNYLQNKFK